MEAAQQTRLTLPTICLSRRCQLTKSSQPMRWLTRLLSPRVMELRESWQDGESPGCLGRHIVVCERWPYPLLYHPSRTFPLGRFTKLACLCSLALTSNPHSLSWGKVDSLPDGNSVALRKYSEHLLQSCSCHQASKLTRLCRSRTYVACEKTSLISRSTECYWPGAWTIVCSDGGIEPSKIINWILLIIRVHTCRLLALEHGILLVCHGLWLVLDNMDSIIEQRPTRRCTRSARRARPVDQPLIALPQSLMSPRRTSPPWEDSLTMVSSTRTSLSSR